MSDFYSPWLQNGIGPTWLAEWKLSLLSFPSVFLIGVAESTYAQECQQIAYRLEGCVAKTTGVPGSSGFPGGNFSVIRLPEQGTTIAASVH